MAAAESQPQVARVEPPPASEPEAKKTPPVNNGGGRNDGVYSGQICYGQTKKEPERCYHAEGTVSGNKIASQWTMGREKKVDMSLDGRVTRSGDVTIEIEMRNKDDGSRQGRIDLTGKLRGGLLSASGSFLRGRPATLNWHKETGAAH
jgi:hypothetical protein